MNERTHILLRNTLTVEQQESESNANHSTSLPSFWPPNNNGRIVLFEVLLPSMADMAQEEAN